MPFTLPAAPDTPFDYQPGDHGSIVPGIRAAVESKVDTLSAVVLKQDGSKEEITLNLPPLTDDEREILLEGCLMNYYAAHAGK